MQESLFGRQEHLYSNGLWSAGCQLLFCVVYDKPHDMPLL